MGDTSVHVCFGYLRGECVHSSSVLYFRKRYDCWLPNTDCIPSAIGMATHQEQLDCSGGVGAGLEGNTSVHKLMTAPNHAKHNRNRQWTCTAVLSWNCRCFRCCPQLVLTTWFRVFPTRRPDTANVSATSCDVGFIFSVSYVVSLPNCRSLPNCQHVLSYLVLFSL